MEWKNEGAKKRAGAALRKLNEILGVNDDGAVTLGFGGEYHTASAIMAEAAKFDRRLRPERRVGVMRRAVVDCRKAEDLSLESVLIRAHRSQKEYLDRPLTPYVLASTISVKHREEINALRFEGTQITFSRVLPRRFRIGDRALRSDLRRDEPAFYTKVRVHVQARDELAAGETAIERLDALRGIWNLFFNWRVRRVSFGSSTGPQNPIVLGRLHTLHHPNGAPVEDRYWWEPHRSRDPQPKDLTSDYGDLKDFEQLVRKGLSRAKYKQNLLDLLARYATALDESDPTSGFLRLWALLEGLTATSNHTKVVKRASFIFYDTAYARLALDHLRAGRNRLVHEAASEDDTDHLLQELRQYVEALLRFLLLHAATFGSLTEFGEFLNLPAERPAIRRRIRQVELASKIYAPE